MRRAEQGDRAARPSPRDTVAVLGLTFLQCCQPRHDLPRTHHRRRGVCESFISYADEMTLILLKLRCSPLHTNVSAILCLPTYFSGNTAFHPNPHLPPRTYTLLQRAMGWARTVLFTLPLLLSNMSAGGASNPSRRLPLRESQPCSRPVTLKKNPFKTEQKHLCDNKNHFEAPRPPAVVDNNAGVSMDNNRNVAHIEDAAGKRSYS